MVLKSEIEKSYLVQQEKMARKSPGLEREILPKLNLNENFVLIITGVRRCGKSTLMHQIAQLKTETKAWFNLEDSRIFGFELHDFNKFREVASEETEIYFFDEIQNVENWEIFIRELHDDGKIICLTGSNASLLSKELGTKLTGRNVQVELFPFSYREFCRFLKLEKSEKSFSKYLHLGGFPAFLKSKQKEYLQQLFKDVAYRDIIVRHGIRQADLFIEIALFLISNVGKEYSVNGIKKAFRVGSANSVANYVQWLEDAYLLFSLPRFSWSLKSIAKNPKKIYTIDAGFAHANSLSYSDDLGRLLENAVYLELRRQFSELFYFRENFECDFIVKEGKKIHTAIQVCWEVNPDNLEREMNGLLEALSYFGLEQGLIITMNQKDEIQKNGKQLKLIPAFEYFSR